MKIWVMPGAADRTVPHPAGGRRYFPQGVPTEIEQDDYIQRRLDDGDLILTAPPAPAQEHTA